MNSEVFDTLSRRTSLTAIGAAGLAALALPLATEAKKKGDSNKRCKKQVGQCEIAINEQLGGGPELAPLLACCQKLKTCNMTAFLACLQANSEN